MTDTANDNLPKAPRDLCFSELSFIQENFDVDSFLQEHRKHAKLETMRDDLGVYLKLLRSAMIDLINRDYNDYVNLSSNLIGLDKAIDDLQMPLGQLKEEVMQVRRVLEDEIEAISNGLSNDQQTRENKQSLCSLQRIYKSLKKLSLILSTNTSIGSVTEVDMMEQAASEFNKLKFHVSRCKLNISNEKKKAEELEYLLIARINTMFLKFIKEKNCISLTRCLRIYIMLDKASDAEHIVKQEVIRPLVDQAIDEIDVQMDPPGLQNFYHKLLYILTGALRQLLDITLYPDRMSVKGFNFLANSFWEEIEEKIEQRINFIFAPGDPELFHKRYVETTEFLANLEAECTPMCLTSLTNHPQYKRFMKKWNLPVYFQIRFQEIAGAVEAALKEPISPASMKGNANSLTSENFSLQETGIVWECLLKIWADNVYTDRLFQKFWKLSLQICSRYCLWCQSTLQQVWPVINETNANEPGCHARVNFLVYLHTDVEKYMKKLSDFLNLVKSKLKKTNDTISNLLEECMKETVGSLEKLLPLITEEIVTDLSMQCIPHLKQVSDIPRLFRRTKREVPTKPCAYVKNAFAPLSSFREEYKLIVPININRWLELSLSSLTKHYLTFVLDVLTSVQKTEESLRRLKKIRDKSTGNFSSESQGISDDEKIRTQLQVDVYGYDSMIGNLEISTLNVSYLQDLIQAVESAIRKS